MSKVFLVMVLLLGFGCKEKAKEVDNSAESDIAEQIAIDKEVTADWQVLFDGSSFDHWKGYLKDDVASPWKIEDGAMVFYPPKEKVQGESYNLVTKEDFTDFVLSLEWKISEGGNSGVFWGIVEDEKYGQPYETGPEIQVLDNKKHPDAKAGTTHQAGALYDMIAPSKDVAKPVGEWNTMVITINHKEKRGNVVLNDTSIVDFPVGNEIWNEMVTTSKFNGWEGFGKFTTGKIGLQDHGDMVSFRNIKIKEL